MSKIEPLRFGNYYHVFNRGNNRETVFRSAENYRFFLQRYAHYILPVAKTFAYCLLPNHFHFSIYVRTPEEQETYHQSCQLSESQQRLNPSKAFANLFTSYAMAFNRRYERTGSLFEKPFKRKPVTNPDYYKTLICYINQNAIKHGIVDEIEDWPWSSYDSILKSGATRLERDVILDLFGGQEEFVDAHSRTINFEDVEQFVHEDGD